MSVLSLFIRPTETGWAVCLCPMVKSSLDIEGSAQDARGLEAGDEFGDDLRSRLLLFGEGHTLASP